MTENGELPELRSTDRCECGLIVAYGEFAHRQSPAHLKAMQKENGAMSTSKKRVLSHQEIMEKGREVRLKVNELKDKGMSNAAIAQELNITENWSARYSKFVRRSSMSTEDEPTNQELASFLIEYAEQIPAIADWDLDEGILKRLIDSSPKYRAGALRHYYRFREKKARKNGSI